MAACKQGVQRRCCYPQQVRSSQLEGKLSSMLAICSRSHSLQLYCRLHQIQVVRLLLM